jgi:hypothetical protein
MARTLRVLPNMRTNGPFVIDGDGFDSIAMDPNAVLDIIIDWTAWLAGDTISTSTMTGTDVTVNSSSNTTTKATAWVTAPTDPRGKIVNKIVTAAGRTQYLTVRIYYEVM